MKKIYLVSGPVQSGKTTFLSNWVMDKNACGILAPVINGKRHLRSLKSNEEKLLEIGNNSEKHNVVKVGRFIFNKKVIEWGQKKLLENFNNKIDWIIIDEIGPLELRGEGLEPALSKIIFSESTLKLVLVIRENLLEKVFDHYGLNNFEKEILKKF